MALYVSKVEPNSISEIAKPILGLRRISNTVDMMLIGTLGP